MEFGKMAHLAGLTLIASLLATAPASSQTAFQPMVDDAYGAYRAALFQTNVNDQKGTLEALATAQAGWTKVVASYRNSPPPAYAADSRFGADIDEVSSLLRRAQSEASAGALPAAHETLEGVRDILGELRRRNGVIVFSDHINAYHTEMEHIIGGEISADDRQRLTEQVGVLVYLDKKIRENASLALQDDAKFRQLSSANTAAIEKLRSALAAGIPAEIKAATEGLKPAYAKLFLAFG